ncbi:MAG: N-acetylmuramoyl-L-alanine amidase [Crocinitomicaceae bacterium]|nr:N-acetylmuramoyl-L-alanine amidase [Crocinitomicaceae bacterium]
MRITLLFLVCLAIYSTSFSWSQKREVTVVIDPGHGGQDPGHVSENKAFATEKELNLKIAMFLGGYIEKYLQNVKVVYTRTSDIYPSLDQRVTKANSINADYFISIHCNGNSRKSVRGTESHVHSMSLKKSVAMAREIEKQFSTRAGRKSRGVKDKGDLQHSIQVLKYTNMPSVLVECGFLTNDREARYLNTTHGQEIIASAIFRGFRSHITKQHPNISFKRPENEINNNSSSTVNGAYSIQIMSSKQPVDPKDSSFRKLKMDVQRTKLNTSSAYKYIYTVGSYATRKEAKAALSTVRTKGFKDAIVIKQ